MSRRSALSERRLAENEVIFREANMRKQSWFYEYKEHANNKGQGATKLDGEVPLSFYCECSDENCAERIDVLPSVYDKTHKDDATFMIIPGHEVRDVEAVIINEPEYSLVKKHRRPSQSTSGKLNKTDVDNA